MALGNFLYRYRLHYGGMAWRYRLYEVIGMALTSVRKVGALLNIGGGPLLVGTFLIWASYRKRASVYWRLFAGDPAPVTTSAGDAAAPVPAASPSAAGGANTTPSATVIAPSILDVILNGLAASAATDINP